MKIVSAIILCIIVVLQYAVGLKACAKENYGCLGSVLFTLWTAILIVLFWFAGVFDFN